VSKSALAALCALGLAGLAACSSSASKSSTATTILPSGVKAGATLPTPTDVPQKLNPCTLLTASEASKLVGVTVTKSAGGGTGALFCKYAAGSTAGAEITVKVVSTPAAAHAQFASWVQPVPGQAVGLKVTTVSHLGNEASATHLPKVNDGIYVRKGAVLVKIGAYPPASDAALRVAAIRALKRTS
jgi:hypothetical protein